MRIKRTKPVFCFIAKIESRAVRYYGMENNWLKLTILNFLVGLSMTFVNVSNASAISKVDVIIDYQTDTARKRLVVEYHPNGKVRLKGYHGHYANKEISTDYYLGTWYYYNPNGTLHHSIYYHNHLPGKAFILKKEYYPNGKVKSIEKYNNYDLYQSEEKKLGKWQYFDNNGKLIKEVQH
ncbi:hypothetical protein EZ437_11635 [Pedobacter psychroterrae]|uniref:MORN repeat protein n=2 Tax=Pedobacter psychroterrae TaxID=2530453 RepID=A0A4R0NKW9_9SPHI|nr:hypothetical protein EZ437_11635 [Pedobacter psychroterrae]